VGVVVAVAVGVALPSPQADNKMEKIKTTKTGTNLEFSLSMIFFSPFNDSSSLLYLILL
jgi:hypothetical protein